LPIALGLLVAMSAVSSDAVERYLALGELSLDGKIEAVAGVLPAALAALSNDLGLICPEKSGGEAAWADGLSIIPAPNLLELINHLKGHQNIAPPKVTVEEVVGAYKDLKDIKGQETAKRALEVIASGGHHMCMVGPPGSGKSMLAARLSGILPPLTSEEILEISMVSSIAGNLLDGQLSVIRPYRAPHHSASMAALTGGGMKALPGEVTLAHRGVLFLDELPEFQRGALDSLRQPIETGEAVVARANMHVTYPAKFQLIAAMNPCRCGGSADPEIGCQRGSKCASDYQSKISGPLMDRFDIHIEVPAVSAMDLTLPPAAEGTKEVAERVLKARKIQEKRYRDLDVYDHVRCNADLEGELLEKVAVIDQATRDLLFKAVDKMKLTARGYHRVLKVARTLADLEGIRDIAQHHVAEALSYRKRPLSL
jgi:magnesium chelatase family protein